MTSKRIKGITIEIGGDTTKLTKALQNVDSQLYKSQGKLKDLNRLLKLDPKNTELLTQKQKTLTKSIDDTKERLKQLKAASEQAAKAQDFPQDKYDALQREIAETEQDLKKLEKEMKEFGSVAKQKLTAVGESFKSVGEKLTNVGTSLSQKVTAPIVAVGALSVKSFAEVDKTMQLTNKTMGNTEEQAKLLNTAMKDAAANSTFGMNDAANASLNFARAGLSAEEAAAALAPAMNLAAGEGGELDTVSAGLVATINGFHGSFDEAGTYADVFANACNNSALDVNGLSEAMSVAAPIFSSAGYTVQDAALYMGVMANNGIDASKGANSLKTGLARLVSPAKDGAKWLDQLGINVTNTDGSMKDSVTIQKELHDAFANLSESEQMAAASAIFGKNQMAPWLALINTAPEDVSKLNTELGATGTTSEMADAMMSGFGGSLEKLKSSIDVAATSFGEALAPTISAVAEKIQGLVDWFNGLDESQQQMIAKIALVVAAVGPVLVVVGKLSTGIGVILPLIGSIGSVLIGTVIPAIGSVLVAITPILPEILLITGAIMVIIGVIKIIIGVIKNWDNITKWFSEQWKKFTKVISDTTENMKKWVSDKWNALKTNVTNTVENIRTGAINRFNALKTGLINTVTSIKDGIVSKLDAIKQAFFDKLTAAKNTVQGIIDKIKGIFNFSWSLPTPKLPHFRISWQSYGPFSLPSFDGIDWYRKAYDNPMLFTSPTVLATNGGLKGFGDGPGAEVVMGLNKLRDLVGGGETTYAPVFNIYAQPGQNIDQLARAVEQRFTRWQRQRETAKV